MTAEANCDTSRSPILLKLNTFSARHRAVAQTWADHFKVLHDYRDRFMLDYLKFTSSTRCWFVALGDGEGEGSGARKALARFGSQLQYFDGRQIWAIAFKPNDRVPLKPPTSKAALQLANRFFERQTSGSSLALLTTFTKRARALAAAESLASLGSKVYRPYGHEPSQEGANRRFFGPRNQFYISNMGGSLKLFWQHLDQRLLHAVRSVQCPSAQLYNWLASGDSNRRLQALKAQPVLVPVLVIGQDVPWPLMATGVPQLCPWADLQEVCVLWDDDFMLDGAEFVGRTADHGLPLNKVFAWLFSAPLAAIRHLGQQRVYDTSSALSRLNFEGLEGGWHDLIAGARLGNRRPNTRSEWRSFYSIRSSIPWQLLISLRDMNNFLKGCPTDWADPAWTEIIAKLVDLRELFDNLDRIGSRQSASIRARLHTFVGSLTFRQLSNFVDAFHAALIDIRANLERDIPPEPSDSFTTWPGLLLNIAPITCEATGLQIVELNCPDDLDREHQSMGHCIDSYDYRAFLGDCRLLSIRSDGQPLASVELILGQSRDVSATGEWTLKHLQVAQIRGHRNRTPADTSSEMKTFEWFIAAVRGGHIPVNLEWPNRALKMSRYADANSIFNIRFGEQVTSWVEHYMERGL
ncbi:PcfJ-like protein [Pseudomonas asturiensis]|uniref:PcfJ-like protein n=1 Tax=Pseudomonas asturiensis TaxID=1190415 RepID=A0A1M7P831_9PSED|nr:PcfJ domain-containing protein [Pseudomonas asturiensis]SHN12571.1 PcfJ-like protein [Pseudomonas asturiensis]